MIQLCFRFDDPSATSNHRLEREIIATFIHYDTPLTAAVIPFRLRGEDTVALRAELAGHLIEGQAKGIVEIAQHGFMHARLSSRPESDPSEFCSLTLTEQLEKIERGGQLLRQVFGRQTAGFVPPWNSYDDNTVRALEKLGYRYISAGMEVPRLSHDLATLPRTCWLHSVHEAIDEARRFRALNPVVIAVFHHFDFKESGEQSARLTVGALGKLLDWIRSQREIEPASIVRAVESRGPLAFGVRCLALRRRLPWRLRFVLPEYALLSSPLRVSSRS